MLPTSQFQSRKQLAHSLGVHTTTVWRWFQEGRVEKDTSTGVPLYRLLIVPASQTTTPPKVEQEPGPLATTKPEEPKQSPTQPCVASTPEPRIEGLEQITDADSAIASNATNLPSSPTAPPPLKTVPPAPQNTANRSQAQTSPPLPPLSARLLSKPKPYLGKTSPPSPGQAPTAVELSDWQAIEPARAGQPGFVEKLIAAGFAVTVIGGVLYAARGLMQRPAVIPVPTRRPSRPKPTRPGHPASNQAHRRNRGVGPPTAPTGPVAKALAKTIVGLMSLGRGRPA